MKNKHNQGFTLIEVLITMAVGLMTALVVSSYLSHVARLNRDLKTSRVVGDIIHAYAENMRYNLSLYQISFDNSIEKEEDLLLFDKLPLALSNGSVVQRTTCPSVGCQAYAGYIIMPNEFVRNLYQVKFVVVSPKGETDWKKTFNYFVTVK